MSNCPNIKYGDIVQVLRTSVKDRGLVSHVFIKAGRRVGTESSAPALCHKTKQVEESEGLNQTASC
jgi:hypothetical protein